MSSDHPIMDIFWNRRYGKDDPDCRDLRKSLRYLDAENMVIGHTVQDDGINSKCDGEIWRVDIGMSAAFGGRGGERIQALEITDYGT
jgi:hypothetical protein